MKVEVRMKMIRWIWIALQFIFVGINIVILVGFVLFRFLPMLKIDKFLSEREGVIGESLFLGPPSFRYSPISVWWNKKEIKDEIDYQILNEADWTLFASRESDCGRNRVVSIFLQEPRATAVITYKKGATEIDEAIILYKNIYLKLPLEKWRQQIVNGESLNLDGYVKDISCPDKN